MQMQVQSAFEDCEEHLTTFKFKFLQAVGGDADHCLIPTLAPPLNGGQKKLLIQLDGEPFIAGLRMNSSYQISA